MSVPEKRAEQAQYDLDTAKAMLAARRYLYVLSCSAFTSSQRAP
jgi:hypothetical protein